MRESHEAYSCFINPQTLRIIIVAHTYLRTHQPDYLTPLYKYYYIVQTNTVFSHRYYKNEERNKNQSLVVVDQN